MSTVQSTLPVDPSCLGLKPIDKDGLSNLAEKGKADPAKVVTLKAKTICEGQFRNATYIRTLEPMIVDEPPHLLGEDKAPNPSETVMAGLGACLSVGIHANATAQNITIQKLELEMEADINITGVWGLGDLGEKRLGFTDVRVKVHLEADADRETLEKLIAHSDFWSPVANTLRNPVNTEISLA